MSLRFPLAVALVLSCAATPRTAAAQEVAPVASSAPIALGLPVHEYKRDEVWPFTLVNGADLLEPLLPITAARHGDVGRIVLQSALPYGLLASAFAARGTDRGTLSEIGRWRWAGIDDSMNNYGVLYGLTAIAGLSTLLPGPEDAAGYSWKLRLDRFTVFAASILFTNLEVELLKPVFSRARPTGHSNASRPSGHAATAFASMAFLSNVLRDTVRPQDEENPIVRIFEEVGCALPYLGAFYVALERVHNRKHYLSDTLLGGALGAFTTQILWNWAFLRTELGSSWMDGLSVACSGRRDFEVAWTFRF